MHISSIAKNFFFPEIKAIAKNRGSLFFLWLIVSASLFSIGLSSGTLKYMKHKMDNPFIRFIDIGLPYGHQDKNEYRNDLRAIGTQDRFGIQSIDLVPTWYSNFKSSSGQNQLAYVRLVNPKGELYQFIKNKPDLIVEKGPGLDAGNSSWGCVVTKGFIERLNRGHLEHKGFIHFVGLFGENDSEITFPIPIALVVEQLPDNHDLLVDKELFFALRGDYFDDNPFDTRHENHQAYLSFFCPSLLNQKEFIQKLKEHELRGYQFLPNPTCKSGFLISKSFNAELKENEVSKLLQFEPNATRYYDPYAVFSKSGKSPSLAPDKLIINLNGLDSIRSLKDYMQSKHKLKVDMNTVESKENFNVFSKFISVLSGVLALFSIVLIIYVISSLLQGHIERNQKNLGTLKAFGIPNTTISAIYGVISLCLVLGIFLLGLVTVNISGNSLTKALFSLFEIAVDDIDGVFDLNPTPLLLSSFLVIPILVLYVHVGILLRGKTPGDLIYGRN